MQILSEQDVINTYDFYQQEQCRLYYGYVKLKSENPSFGYKKISKLLGQSSAKTRWWHAGKHLPVPIQTVQWLKEKGLLPLEVDHPKIRLITKLFGATYGDGGVFGNLNAIFLSSAELSAVEEFGKDLEGLFGLNFMENARIIEGGEYGHSWCYQNTNRNIIRFFVALGAPLGDKSFVELKIPKWVYLKEQLQDDFFASLFGAELGVPKIHISRRSLDTLSLGMTASEQLAQNRIEFLTEVARYLNKKTIETGKISVNDHKKENRKGEPTKIYRLLISVEFENVTNFITLTNMHYCKYKKEKLTDTMNDFSQIKRKRLAELLEQGYDKVNAVNLLNLTPAALYIIENYEPFDDLYEVEREYDKDVVSQPWYQLLLKDGIVDVDGNVLCTPPSVELLAKFRETD